MLHSGYLFVLAQVIHYQKPWTVAPDHILQRHPVRHTLCNLRFHLNYVDQAFLQIRSERVIGMVINEHITLSKSDPCLLIIGGLHPTKEIHEVIKVSRRAHGVMTYLPLNNKAIYRH